MTSETRVLSAADLPTYREDLIEMFIDTVNGGALMSYTPPITREESVEFWDQVAAKLADERVILLVALENGVAVGTVQIIPVWQPNGHHRAEIAKMMVHSTQRRKGVGRALLAAAEQAALDHGYWLLYLDTERYSSGEYLYTALGWQRVGVIPQYALNHQGEYTDTVLFYKLLR